MTCNGWSNWATWNVNLYLTNDEGTQSACATLVHDALLGSDDMAGAEHDLAKALRDYAEEALCDLGSLTGFVADAVTSVLDDDFDEIAHAMLDGETHPSDESDDEEGEVAP